MSGMSSSVENSTSTTGPMTRATRPVPSGASSPPASEVFSTVAVMSSLFPCDGLGQRVGSADDLAYFLGDLGLPGLVGLAGKPLEQVVGVVGGRLHGPAAGRDLRRGRLEQRDVDAALHIPRQERVQHGLWRGLEFIQRDRAAHGLLAGLLDDQWDDAVH